MPIHRVESDSESIATAIKDAEKAGETVIQVTTAVDPATSRDVALVITEKRGPISPVRPKETRA